MNEKTNERLGITLRALCELMSYRESWMFQLGKQPNGREANKNEPAIKLRAERLSKRDWKRYEEIILSRLESFPTTDHEDQSPVLYLSRPLPPQCHHTESSSPVSRNPI
jgi:hypothetical protein